MHALRAHERLCNSVCTRLEAKNCREGIHGPPHVHACCAACSCKVCLLFSPLKTICGLRSREIKVRDDCDCVLVHGRRLAVALLVAVLADCVRSCGRADVHRYRRGELGPAQAADEDPLSGIVVHMSVLMLLVVIARSRVCPFLSNRLWTLPCVSKAVIAQPFCSLMPYLLFHFLWSWHCIHLLDCQLTLCLGVRLGIKETVV